jgi:hypothetical protein
MSRHRSAEELANLIESIPPGGTLELYSDERMDEALALIAGRKAATLKPDDEHTGDFWSTIVIDQNDPLKTPRELIEMRQKAAAGDMPEPCLAEIDRAFAIVMQSIRAISR